MSDTEMTAEGDIVNATKPEAKTDTKPHHFTLVGIDAMAGKRDNFILVMIDNPKVPGSQADMLWPLQGQKGKPTVTVGAFLAAGETMFNRNRARTDLLYNLNEGYVKICDQNGNVILGNALKMKRGRRS